MNLSTLRCMFNGGEPVRWSTIERFEERFSAPGVITPSYGLAEATVGVTMTEPGEERAVDERGNVSSGRPKWGAQVRAGQDVEHPDEILVRGDVVFAGYLDAPEETAQALRDGWLHTGDAGYLDDSGRLYVLGRRAGMLKRGGGVIAPQELEEAAQLVDGIRVAAATSMSDPDHDEDLIVLVVEAEESPERTREQIAQEVSRAVAASLGFAPSRVEVMPPRSIPLTENGKVRHRRLRDELLSRLG